MKKETTIREFVEENNLIAKLVCVIDYDTKEQQEAFVNEDSFLTKDESQACIYEPQDLDELIEHGETLLKVLNGVYAIFYAPDGGNTTAWFTKEELDEPMDENNVLFELIAE